jgi:hypothetical protein
LAAGVGDSEVVRKGDGLGRGLSEAGLLLGAPTWRPLGLPLGGTVGGGVVGFALQSLQNVKRVFTALASTLKRGTHPGRVPFGNWERTESVLCRPRHWSTSLLDIYGTLDKLTPLVIERVKKGLEEVTTLGPFTCSLRHATYARRSDLAYVLHFTLCQALYAKLTRNFHTGSVV